MSILLVSILPFCWIVAAISDSYSMKIPNSISLTLLGTFPFVAYYFALPLPSSLLCIAAAIMVLLPGFLLYLTGQVGAGDVKLLSASALWLGLTQALIEFIVLASLLGAALVFVTFGARIMASKLILLGIKLPKYVLQGNKIPYGIAICLAGLLVYPNSQIMELAIVRMALQ